MSKSRAVGADPGTMFFQVAEKLEDGVQTQVVRNAFVELEASEDTEEMLIRNNWNFVKDTDPSGGLKYYITGEDALKVAKMFPGKVKLRRPLEGGVLNKGEDKKLLVLGKIIESTIGDAPDDKSVVTTCVSSESVDESQNSTFHRRRLEALFASRGWNVKIIEEAHAVILSERPTVTEPDGTESAYSGIGISCLLPSTKIYTKRGIIPIENVVIGDEVITHLGRWNKVDNIIVKNFEGTSTHLQITGYSNNTNEYGFVDNHELYVRRNNEWKWVGCEDVKEGDEVGEPILRHNNEGVASINICERITCSSEYTKKRIEASADVCRLMGYFLADGSINRQNNEGINFKFGPNELQYAQDVAEILTKNFDKTSTIEKNDEYTRVLCYSKGMGNWFRNHCYDSDGNKVFPWDLCRLSYGQVLNLLTGLIRGDGWISDGIIAFGNTSSQVSMIAKQCFNRIGYPSSISIIEPRISSIEGRPIIGTQPTWQVYCGQKSAFSSLSHTIEKMSCENSKYIQKLRIEDNFCIGTVQKIDNREYTGKVYDLQVANDHSFSGPMLTIHNCGAGRVNCVLTYKGVQIIGMSAERSGDWIDKQVAEATVGLDNIALCIGFKENTLDFTKILEQSDDPKTGDIALAYDTYYDAMLRYVFNVFSKKFLEVKSEFDAPLDIVVAGGTSVPKGFIPKLKKVVDGMKVPFRIKDVRHAKDPRNAVVYGCLAHAIASQKKLEKEGA